MFSSCGAVIYDVGRTYRLLLTVHTRTIGLRGRRGSGSGR